ncbi:DUF2304 domain-containing protein [Microbacterium sp.]|jgi:hypothetical protein|uniref:DUF2304 domain-containing protein n=1 Tax=Microbacterium sp. TaxID=51671 RepID=UPI002D784F98|nr:DUF2304 domain-containing protein [Microbacterium sp.]HET6303090.1 DUF2304 domain-containing protein [Microbacterium sp.]
MWIQLLLIAGVVVIGALLMRRTGADSHLAIRRMLSGLFILAAILSILFPQWLSWVANLVGVGRGTDLLLYGLVIAFLASLYTQYRHNLATQRQVTLLARKVALLEAKQHEDSAPAPTASEDR